MIRKAPPSGVASALARRTRGAGWPGSTSACRRWSRNRASSSVTRRYFRGPLSADAGRLVDVRVFAEVWHHLFREELHQLERALVAAAVHRRAEDPGLELVREDPELVADGRGAAVDEVAVPFGLLEGELARQ